MANKYYVFLQYSPLIPLLYGLFQLRKLDEPLKYFMLWLTFSLFLTIVMTGMAMERIHNLWVMNLSLPCYSLVILWMFSLWEANPGIRLAMRMSIVAFAAIWALEMVFGSGPFVFTEFSRPIMNLIFVAISSRTIYLANNDESELLTDQPRFWIASGLILYYGGSITINSLSNALLHISNETLRSALYIQPALSLVSHISYTIALNRQCRR